MKVLVVDDDPHLRDALEVGLQLQSADTHVVSAADGETGLDVFFHDRPDIVLLDISMPRMDGFEVLEQIRRVSEVPVVMLTARGSRLDEMHGRALGADDHVDKPVNHLVLMARMQAVLERSGGPTFVLT
jgi:DNA-binding response OmpR family regulator